MPALTGQTTVGNTAVQVLNTSSPLQYGVKIKASNANGGYVYIGFANTVTITTGLELAAGQCEFIGAQMCANLNALYLISNAASQSISFAAF